MALCALNFRHYLAALCRRPADEFAAPPAWQLQRQFDESGSLTVRPIATDVFSTFIEVGVNTSAKPAGPDTRSIFFDVPSNTWHDEA